MHDLAIRNGRVIDGSGGPEYQGDIGIDGGTIAAVGANVGPARREIDAAGKLVTPGWIDMHTHFDAQVAWDPFLTPSCWNGVTTVVMGNCGVGFAPVHPQGPRLADGPDGRGRGYPGDRDVGRHEVGLGDVPGIPGRDRPQAARDGHPDPAPALRAAHLRDGRARRRGHPADRRRVGRDDPHRAPGDRGGGVRRVQQPPARAPHQDGRVDTRNPGPLSRDRGDRQGRGRGRWRRAAVRRAVRARVALLRGPDGRHQRDLPHGRRRARDAGPAGGEGVRQRLAGVSPGPRPRHHDHHEPGGIAASVHDQLRVPGVGRLTADGGAATQDARSRGAGADSGQRLGSDQRRAQEGRQQVWRGRPRRQHVRRRHHAGQPAAVVAGADHRQSRESLRARRSARLRTGRGGQRRHLRQHARHLRPSRRSTTCSPPTAARPC